MPGDVDPVDLCAAVARQRHDPRSDRFGYRPAGIGRALIIPVAEIGETGTLQQHFAVRRETGPL